MPIIIAVVAVSLIAIFAITIYTGKYGNNSLTLEGKEEVTQEYVDAMFRMAILGEEIDVVELTQQGLHSFALGSVSGGIMNTPSLSMNLAAIHQSQSLIDNSNMSYEQILNKLNEYGVTVDESKNQNPEIIFQQLLESNPTEIYKILNKIPNNETANSNQTQNITNNIEIKNIQDYTSIEDNISTLEAELENKMNEYNELLAIKNSYDYQIYNNHIKEGHTVTYNEIYQNLEKNMQNKTAEMELIESKISDQKGMTLEQLESQKSKSAVGIEVQTKADEFANYNANKGRDSIITVDSDIEMNLKNNEILKSDFSISSDRIFSDTIDYIRYDDFVKTSIDEQINTIQTINLSKLVKIVESNDLSLEVKNALNQRLIDEQDIVTLGVSILSRDNFFKYIISNPYLLESMSNNNLVRIMSAVPKSDTSGINNIYSEISKRFDSGDIVFNTCFMQENLFFQKDVVLQALMNLPTDLKDKFLYKANEIITTYLPKEFADIDFGYIYQKLSLSEMIKNNKIDSNGMRIIKELYNENRNSFKTFNFNLLDSNIIKDFDSNFIKEIGKYDNLSHRLLELHNSTNAYNAFVNIYKDSIGDNSLNNLYFKIKHSLNFLFENKKSLEGIEKIESYNLLDYILSRNKKFGKNNKNIKIGFSNDYHTNLNNECDALFNKQYDLYNKHPDLKLYDIKEMKNLYFQKYFSMTIDDAEALIFKYYDHIDEIIKYMDDADGQRSLIVLEYLKKITDIDDPNYLKEIYENQEFRITNEEIFYIDDILRKKYSQSYADALKNTESILFDKSILNQVIYDGNVVNIVDANDKFALLVHSSDSGLVKNKKLINNSFIDTWNNIDNAATHGLSTSFITNTNIGSCPVKDNGVLYGFTNIKSSDIKMMGSYDINSNIADFGFSSNNLQQFISADNISKNTTRVYNEFVLSRNEIKPTCVVLFNDASDKVIQNTYKAAAEWNIPVFKIDKAKLAERNVQTITSLLYDFNETKDLSKLQKSIELYESNVSGFKLNTIVSDKDVTSSIDNSAFISTFDSTNITSIINNYVNSMIKNDNKEELGKLLSIFEQVKIAYDISNENGTDAIAHTQSNLNLGELINKIKGVITNE